jgi:hypothetical protein
MVSCSALRSFESMVAAAFRSRDPTHVEQNRPFEETCAPHEEQYMGGEILPLRAADRELPPNVCRQTSRSELRNALNLNGGAVGQYFGDPLHDFGGVVTHADDGIRSMFSGVLQKQLVGVFPSFLAKIRENRDVAAYDRLQRGAEIPDDAARPDDNASHNPEVSDDAVTG